VSSITGHRCPDCRRPLVFPNIIFAPADFTRIAAHAATHGVTMTISPLPPMIAGDDGDLLTIQGFHCRHCRSFHVTNVFWFSD
jgi:hypothetical protein